MSKTNLCFLYLKYFLIFRAKSGSTYALTPQLPINKLFGSTTYRHGITSLGFKDFKVNEDRFLIKNYLYFYKRTLTFDYLFVVQNLSLYSNNTYCVKSMHHVVSYSANILNKLDLRFNLLTEGRVTNHNSLQIMRNKAYLPLLSLQNKVKTSFLKKSLITNLFTLQLSQNINSPLFFKLCSAKLIPTFFTHHISYIFKKFKRYGVFFGGPTKLMEFVIISFLTIISKDLTFFNT